MSRSDKKPQQHRTDLADVWKLLDHLRQAYANQLADGGYRTDTLQRFDRAKATIEDAVAWIEDAAGLPPRKTGKQDTLFDGGV